MDMKKFLSAVCKMRGHETKLVENTVLHVSYCCICNEQNQAFKNYGVSVPQKMSLEEALQ